MNDWLVTLCIAIHKSLIRVFRGAAQTVHYVYITGARKPGSSFPAEHARQIYRDKLIRDSGLEDGEEDVVQVFDKNDHNLITVTDCY